MKNVYFFFVAEVTKNKTLLKLNMYQEYIDLIVFELCIHVYTRTYDHVELFDKLNFT